jgi:hypothetical protein
MIDFSFLDKEQIFGENRLEIFKEYGTKAAITDFSILLGGYVNNDYHTKEGNTDKDRIGWWWTRTDDGYNDACVVSDYGDSRYNNVYDRDGGARPALPYSSISSISSNEVRGSFGIKEVEYGEYPQTIVDEPFSRELEKNYKRGSGIRKTGKTYTTDSVDYDDHDRSFEPRKHEEFEYKGRRYIRIVGDHNGEDYNLSDGRIIVSGEPYWVAVEPIKWLVDERANIALSKKIIFSGVQFKKTQDYKGDFNRTDIKQFIDKHFAKEIVSSKDDILVDAETSKLESADVSNKKIGLENPYKFNLDSVTEDNIIRGCIKSGVPVFLHGASSEGKSARVKQIDPKLVKLSLAGITPEKLNGRSVYNSVKDIMEDKKPTWLERLEEICASESDENHILFLDELSNALPSIQGMVYHLVLDREVNDRWKLPDNARIVLAGNEMKDSLAANKVVEPLFNRCAHVYIKTDLKDWLIWASQNKLHSSIISFMIYTKGKYLRSKFDGEKPNADPRKWEMASKILYKTKKPEMIRALVGEKITHEFCKFCNTKIISLDDVLNGNYDYNYLSMLDETEKYAIVVELCNVDIDNLEVVRNFLSKLGEGYLTTFDLIYCFDKKEKMDAIVEQYQKVKKK